MNSLNMMYYYSMNKLKNNVKGFGTIEVILVIVIVGLIGVIGWMVYSKNHKTKVTITISKNTTIPNTPSAPSFTASKARLDYAPDYNYSGWITYTNPQANFSITIPPLMLSGAGAPCTQVSYVYDNYGNKIPSSPSYIPTSANVPVTVVGEGQNFFVAEKYTYQPTDDVNTADGHTLAMNCQKMTTTASLLENISTNDYSFGVLPFQVLQVNNQQDILEWAQKKFNDNTITITSMTKDSSGNWLNVNLASNNDMTFNFKYELRYYQPEKILVYLEQGQSGHIQIPNTSISNNNLGFYDQQIWNSFKLLN